MWLCLHVVYESLGKIFILYSDNYSSSQTHQSQQRGDEQSALAKILHKTAR